MESKVLGSGFVEEYRGQSVDVGNNDSVIVYGGCKAGVGIRWLGFSWHPFSVYSS